jgi:hypothetical protein
MLEVESIVPLDVQGTAEFSASYEFASKTLEHSPTKNSKESMSQYLNLKSFKDKDVTIKTQISKSLFAKKFESNKLLSSEQEIAIERDLTQIGSQISNSSAQSTSVKRARKYLTLGLKEKFTPQVFKSLIISVWIFVILFTGLVLIEYFNSVNMTNLVKSNME